MKGKKLPCNECRLANTLTWLGMCAACTLSEVERRLIARPRNDMPRAKDLP